MINCVLLLVLETGALPVETTAAVTEIDSIIQNCLDQDLLSPARRFLGTMKPVQGPGIKSWKVFIRGNRIRTSGQRYTYETASLQNGLSFQPCRL